VETRTRPEEFCAISTSSTDRASLSHRIRGCNSCRTRVVGGFENPGDLVLLSATQCQLRRTAELESSDGRYRFTRLTNAFSKKFENHCHMIAIYHAYYNFCRVRQALRVTPAMEAGISDRIWTIEELVSLLEHEELKEAA
ncbi:MAG: hypothetical protein WCB05_17995, partial [Candidatus Sulfotelmatobacter sp.]